MKTTNALKMRQNLGAVLDELYTTGEPIGVERRGRRVAVLISWEQFQKRFVDKKVDLERKKIVEEILNSNFKISGNLQSLDVIRSGRR